jgi:peptide deformylase
MPARSAARPTIGVESPMAILDIILEGDPRLRQKTTRVRTVDAALRALAADMRQTMLEAPGVGLAAPQVGVNRRLFVAHIPAGYDEEDDPEFNLAMVNPEIVKGHGRVVALEGCLSIPGWVGEVPRYETITVKGMDLNNRNIRLKVRGYAARVVQHEIDHLDGILFTDRIEDPSTFQRVEEEDVSAA